LDAVGGATSTSSPFHRLLPVFLCCVTFSFLFSGATGSGTCQQITTLFACAKMSLISNNGGAIVTIVVLMMMLSLFDGFMLGRNLSGSQNTWCLSISLELERKRELRRPRRVGGSFAMFFGRIQPIRSLHL